MTVQRLKVGVSGVRGVVGESLSPALILRFAAAFGEYVGPGRVLVGRDTRPTGPMLEQAVVAGLLSVGCQPMLVDVVPTPTVQMLVQDLSARGGIVITASHNPVEWNALKFIGPSGIFLNYTEAAELLDVYNQPTRKYAPETQYRNIRTLSNPFEAHSRRIFDAVDLELIRRKKFRVAVDCCNGAGAYHARKFLENLGCEVFTVFDEKDGIFRRGLEPVAENLTALSETIRANQCDIGFAQDPDADRITIVNAQGQPIGEQLSVVLAAEHILAQTPGPVVVNIDTTKSIDDVAAKYGAQVVRSKVGEINVTTEMLKLNAVIGGEGGSGGVIWPKVHHCRDSFTGMALLLELLATRDASLQEILSTIPLYHGRQQKVPCSGQQANLLIRKLAEKYADCQPNQIDGLRLDWPDRWVLIRPSNTEPILRICVEADTPEKAEELLEQFKKEVAAASA